MSKTSKKSKQADAKKEKIPTISTEELAKRKAAAQQRAAANREQVIQRAKLSDDERTEIKTQQTDQKLKANDFKWDCSHAARLQFCLYASLACLVLTPLRLDPTVGAASCQQYAILNVIYYSILRSTFTEQEWQRVQKMCKNFLGAAAVEDPRTNLLPAVDYKLSYIPLELQDFRGRCEALFTQSQLRYLQLALALWESSVLSFDEFGQVCRMRGNASLGKYEAELRSEFTCLADQLYIQETAKLNNDSLCELFKRSTSQYYMDQDRKWPVKCPSVFITFLINNHLAWELDLFVAIGITRVGMHRKFRIEDPKLTSGNPVSYQLGFCDILYYRKGPAGFSRIEHPTEEQKSQACLFFDCVGTTFVDGSKGDMFSLDKSKFRRFFETVDPAWLFASWAAGHPDHAKRAEQCPPLSSIMDDIYGSDIRRLSHSPRELESLDLSLPREDQATPAEMLQYGVRQATINQQVGERYFNDITVEKDDAVPRTTNELYFHIVHVYSSTGEIEEQKQRLIEERHAALPKLPAETRLGGFLFTAGRAGYSCETKAQAVALQASNSRMRTYIEQYPQNTAFCVGEKAKRATSSGDVRGSRVYEPLQSGLMSNGMLPLTAAICVK